jgi:uncharacterized protein (DUF2236 family)
VFEPAVETTADPGLFGPDTMTWRVHADPILWVAGLRALLLQALHPAAMAGVLEHSDFRADPWGRLLRTADYVGVVTFGSADEVDRLGARVRGLHRQVRGVDALTGVRYDATDPHLLAWVHCCEVESFVTTFQRATGALAPADIDTYYAEQTRAAAVVGLDATEMPSSDAEMTAYFQQMRSELAVDGRARRVASYVLVPPMPRWAAWGPPRPAWAGAAGLAAALLPGWARRLYGLPTLPGGDAAATVALRALHATMRAAPRRFREGPHLRAARERLGLTPAA